MGMWRGFAARVVHIFERVERRRRRSIGGGTDSSFIFNTWHVLDDWPFENHPFGWVSLEPNKWESQVPRPSLSWTWKNFKLSNKHKKLIRFSFHAHITPYTKQLLDFSKFYWHADLCLNNNIFCETKQGDGQCISLW